MAVVIKTDRVLFTAILLLLLAGLFFVYSATSVTKAGVASYGPLVKHGAATLIGLTAMLVLKNRHHFQFRNPLFALGPLLMTGGLAVVALLFSGKKRRLDFGAIQVQPSELMKPAIFLALAWVIYICRGRINEARVFWPLLGGLGLCAGLIGKSDLGTGVVLAISIGAVLWAAGLDLRRMMLTSALGLMLMVGLIFSDAYRLARLVAWLDPKLETASSMGFKPFVETHLKKTTMKPDNYQSEQSVIAIGSGGWKGRGPMLGRQKVRYLPEAHNDFIYAVVGEETGLGGSLLILAGYLVILWRGLEVYRGTSDPFGRHLALGITVCITAQALINMSVALNLGPTKGLPLPLVSYGGSAMIGTLVMLGLLLSVSDHSVLDERTA
jgi:cell division protein FtsW